MTFLCGVKSGRIHGDAHRLLEVEGRQTDRDTQPDMTTTASGALQLNGDQLPALETALKQELPRSFKVYGDLRSHLLGRWPSATFWVDSWPEFKVVLSRSFLDCAEGSVGGTMTSNGVFARDAGPLPSMIQDVVDWNTTVEFTAVERSLLPVTERAGRARGLPLTNSLNVHLYAATRSSLVEWPVPQGFSLSPVSAGEAAAIARSWKYHKPGVEQFVRNLVASCPSLCLHDDQGRSVGHELAYQHHTPGMLFVQPQFRGQGYGKVIVSRMAGLFLEEDDVVFATVEEGNDSGRRVHEVCGFRKVPDFVCKWQFFDQR